LTGRITRIVIITSIAVAATASAFSARFDDFARVGGIIGTSVSAGFLTLLAGINGYILYKLAKQMQELTHPQRSASASQTGEGGVVGEWNVQGAGCLVQVFKGVFKMIDRPWKMYPLGVLCRRFSYSIPKLLGVFFYL
jgi:high-affinity nickel-transport protein